MAGMINRLLSQDVLVEDDEEPPPDMLAECDSDETILAVQNALAERYEVIPIESDEYAYERLKAAHPHLVFNIAERVFGPNRESHIPSICEILNLPYTGSDPLTLSLCLDKSRAKEILSYYQIANARFWTVETMAELPRDVPLPVIVKPMYEGSSKGVKNNSVVYTTQDFAERVQEVLSLYKQPVIVEQFLTGREFTVGVLGNPPNLEILPIVEIDHSKLPPGAVPIYSYEAKWIYVAPLPFPSLWALIVPPCISIMALLIVRPRPRPPNWRVTPRSPCSKGWKMCGSASGGMPTPLSFTSAIT